MYKSLVIIIDDFSDRIFEIDYDNVTLFDYGYRDEIVLYDYVWDGAGNYTNLLTRTYLYTDTSPGFEPIHDPGKVITITSDNSQYKMIDSILLTDLYGSKLYADTYRKITRLDTTYTTIPCHRDWVLESFFQQLDNPELTEVISIDVDTLKGYGNQWDQLFQTKYNELGFGYYPRVINVLIDFMFMYNQTLTGNSSDPFSGN